MGVPISAGPPPLPSSGLEYNGTTSRTNIFSTDFRTNFDGNEVFMYVLPTVDDSAQWGSSVEWRCITIAVNNSNRHFFGKRTGVLNELYWRSTCGGTIQELATTSLGGSTSEFGMGVYNSDSADSYKLSLIHI